MRRDKPKSVVSLTSEMTEVTQTVVVTLINEKRDPGPTVPTGALSVFVPSYHNDICGRKSCAPLHC